MIAEIKDATVERQGDDELQKEEWVFSFSHQTGKIHLLRYRKMSRKTKRHSWSGEFLFDRTWRSTINTERKDVAVPVDIILAAMNEIRSQIVYGDSAIDSRNSEVSP